MTSLIWRPFQIRFRSTKLPFCGWPVCLIGNKTAKLGYEKSQNYPAPLIYGVARSYPHFPIWETDWDKAGTCTIYARLDARFEGVDAP